MIPRLTRLTTSSCLALSMTTAAALADLTAEDVWSDWKSYMTNFGYQMSGVESQTSTGLIISGVTMIIPLSESDGEVKMNIGDLNLIEQGDGSVRIETAEVWRFDVTGEDDEAGDISANVTFTQTAPNLVVSGTPADMQYDYSAAKAVMAIDEITVENEDLSSDAFQLAITLDDLVSATRVTTSDLRSYDQSFESAKISYDLKFQSPEEGNSLDMRGEALGLRLTGNSVVPDGVNSDNTSALIAAGFEFDATYDFQSGSSTTSIQDESGGFTSNSTSQGGTFVLSMSGDGLAYETEARGLALNAVMSTFPLPVSMEIQSAVMNMLIPTVKGPGAQDFGMTLSLNGVSMADTLWGLFDPSGQLPRDPATLTVDLAGKAKLLFDYLDPAQAAVLEGTGASPGEVESLDIKALELDVAGARLTGDGGFVFDNADTVTFGGLPRPEGGVNFTLTGGNGLLDKLVSIGLIPQDQAMGARMMMGLFARPGGAPDELLSNIEINAQGHILANGQRIR